MGSCSDSGLPKGSAKREDVDATEGELQQAERLGTAWLQRYRRIEGSSLLPSVEPLNELLLGLDFFSDLREEDMRCISAAAAVAGKTKESTEADKQEAAEAPPGEEPEDDGACDGDTTLEEEAASAKSERGFPSHLRAIPTVIRNENQYVGFFLPLFLQEAKQALARAIKLDLGSAEEFVQLSGEPSGPFLSLLLSRSSGPGGASASACRYCHGDLVLLFVPASPTGSAEQLSSTDGQGCKGSTDGNKEGADNGGVSAEGQSRPEEKGESMRLAAKPLRARDVDCHVLGLVSQGQHESITVKVLTPSLGPAVNGKAVGEMDLSVIYNPATGRPDGFLRPRDRRRMTRLANALNAQLTRWTVHRLMSLTTLHREFQGLMSLPDLLLKESLFRVPDPGSDPQRQSLRSKMMGPLTNPLLKGKDEDTREPTEVMDADFSPATKASRVKPDADSGNNASFKATSSLDKAVDGISSEPKPLEAAADDPPGGSPKPSERRLVIPDALRVRLKSLYNASQLAALEDSLKVKGITLIQGPPGTGKTSTIVGVVSVILHAQLQGQKGAPSLSKALCETVATARSPETLESHLASNTTRARTKSCPWLQPEYSAWMDADEVALEDLDCQLVLQPAAVPTDPPICLARERHELQPVRVLVCAPSNAAIDEIVKRLTADPETGGGIFDGNGQRFSPSVVRVGPNVHPDLLQHSLQFKALQRLKTKGAMNFSALAAAKAEVLRDCIIVCATMSVCGSNDLTSLADCFDTVVVDEASQAVELATLIPLRLGCRRLILVGDPKQLPATIFSRIAIQLRYDRSLFQRLEGAGQSTNMLSQQYRMHPAISRFASCSFYEGLLRDAAHLPKGLWTPFPSWHRLPILQPFVFFNLDSEHTEDHTSLVNYAEADFVRQLVDFLRRLFIASGHIKWEHRLAVISPYAQQVQLLRRTIKVLLGVSDGKSCPVDVNTVDGFQGQEKDFIIFSAVRGVQSDKKEAKQSTVGFLGDMRRLNVAVTRGRVNLWLVGNGCFLRKDRTWARLYTYAKDRRALISINQKNAQHAAILTKWVLKYCKNHPREKKLLEEHAPSFLTDLAESLKAMKERKQRRGAKEDDEQGDELQTEGPVSWEKPIDECGADEEGIVNGEMKTFHDIADEGCLDEVAVQMRDETLKKAAEAETPEIQAKPPETDKETHQPNKY